MSWQLTEEEQRQLMKAVKGAITPWLGRHESTILFEGKDMKIHVTGVRDKAPKGIRELNAVYEAIIEKGAFAVNSEYLSTKSEDEAL